MAAARPISKLRLPPLPTIKDILRLYRLRAYKELSQNFLLEERLTDKIVRAAGPIQDGYVCEVGPGPGGITRSILKKNPKTLTVIEKDPRFLPSLELLGNATQGSVDFNVIVNDILKTDLSKIFPDAPKLNFDQSPPNVHLIGNLPFSISTILVIRFLEAISKKEGPFVYGRTRMTLTFQKEIAERMVAPVLKKGRCRLSVMCQNWCKVTHKFTIPGKAFLPKPDVDVGVVVLTPLKTPIIPLDFKLVEKVLRHIFSLRQKYSIRGAKTLFPAELRDMLADRMYKVADLDPTIRPFQITNGEFKRLCFAYHDIIQEYPDLADFNFRMPKKDLAQLSFKHYLPVPETDAFVADDLDIEKCQ